MNFKSVTVIFCLLESSISSYKAYLLWLLEQHHYHHRNKFWELGFSFLYLLNQILGFDCKFSLKKKKKKTWNCKWLIINIWSNEVWVLGYFILFYFWLIWSWIVYFVLLSGLVIFWSIRNINRKSEVLLSIGFLAASSKGVDKLLIWEFKF